MARYTVRGGSQRAAAAASAPTITDQMQRLLDYAKGGSVVAQHMLKTRELWMLGECALEERDYYNAVRFFALSARASHSDGNHFSGWWRLEVFERYHKALDFISQSSSSSQAQILDGKLVRAWMCMPQSKWSAMEEILTECITQCAAQGSGDAYDFYRMRFLSRGNVSDWRGLIDDAECCIQMQPEDPMPYFWKGVAIGHLYSDTGDAAKQRRDTASRKNAFRRFIEIAPLEGRKGDAVTVKGLKTKPQHNGKTSNVIGHTSDRVQLQLQDNTMTVLALKPVNLKPNMDELIKIIDKGFEAEEKMLPILREHEAMTEDSGAKSICIMMRKAIQHKGENPRSIPLIRDLFKARKERANEAFRSKRYEKAVDEYSNLIDMNDEHDGESTFSDMHLVLSNRSAAFEKLQDFDAAERDALEAIKLKTEWVKGYARLARARIGCFNAAGALQALEQARANLAPSDFDGIRDLESEVQSLLAQGVPKRCDPVLLKCWPSVQFKDSHLVVDAKGRGDFVSLRQALVGRENPTTIIVLAGSYTLRGVKNVKMKSFQIIGDGNVNVAGDISSESATLFSAFNADTHMYLENLKIRFVADETRHCVAVSSGARATVTRCEMRSSGASCFSDGQGSSLVLLECKTFGPGAGPLVTNYGLMEAHDCHFSRSKVMGVEVRTFGSCLLKHCTMSDNSGQGICVHNNGNEAELQDCIIQKCGQINRCGAVMVSSGKVALRRCSIADNPGDGIVVQDENGAAHLELSSCKVHNNGGMGLVMYGGSGHIVDNRFQENANSSVGIHQNYDNRLPFREIQFARNLFCSGDRSPILVLVPLSMEVEVHKLVTFDNNNDTLGARHAVFCIEEIPYKIRDLNEKIELTGNKVLVDIRTGLEEVDPFQGSLSSSIEKMREDAAAVNRMHNQHVKNRDFSFVHFNKESLVSAHERIVDAMEDNYVRNMLRTEHVPYTIPGPLPTNRATGSSLSGLRECRIMDLVPHMGKKAIGLVLYGTFCTRPHRIMSLMTILEDSGGDSLLIALYNVSSVNSERWRECFPKGMRIGIKEPFLKRFADASVGIRVDDPSDIVYVTPVCMRLGCGIATTAKLELKVCSRCLLSRYCSARCQKLDWNDGHKNSCQPALPTLHTDPYGDFNAGDSRMQGLARSEENNTSLHLTTSHAP